MKTIHRLVFAVFALALATTANAAEIKVLCSNGIRAVVDELIPKFELRLKEMMLFSLVNYQLLIQTS